jgi:hypothetical protein
MEKRDADEHFHPRLSLYPNDDGQQLAEVTAIAEHQVADHDHTNPEKIGIRSNGEEA